MLKAALVSVKSMLGGSGKDPKHHVLHKTYCDVSKVYALHKDELGRGQYGMIRKCMHIKSGKVYACKTIDKECIKVWRAAIS